MRDMETLKRPSEESLKREGEPDSFHFDTPEIREMAFPMLTMVKEMREEINNEEYDTLISDEASGRLLTLTLRKVMQSKIKEVRPDLTPEEARDSLKTFFVAPGYPQHEEPTLEFFKKIKPNMKKKALIVTEYIQTGESMAKLVSLLEGVGIAFDVSSMTVSNAPGYEKRDEILEKIKKKHKLFVGELSGRPPKIWDSPHLAGVKKGDKPSAHPILRESQDQEAQEIKANAREDVDTLVRFLLHRMDEGVKK